MRRKHCQRIGRQGLYLLKRVSRAAQGLFLLAHAPFAFAKMLILRAQSQSFVTTALIVFVLKSTDAALTSSCPNSCSGNGICDATTLQCNCFAQWTGYNCGIQKCPSGPAWVSTPHSAVDDVHSTESSHLVECSGVGDCISGRCTCSAPYSGSACERIRCPGTGSLPCNGNGRCISLSEAGSFKDDVNFFSVNSYSNWDAERIMGCVCDDAFTGYDCSLRKCAFGDDPHSGTGDDEIQRISCTATSGTFNVKFRGHLTSNLNFNDSPNTLKAALVDLPSIRDLALTVYDSVNTPLNAASGAVCGTGYYWLVTFTSVPGDVPDLAFPKEAASSQPAFVSTTQVAQTTSHECSNRGVCTRTGDSAGQCTCQSGYTSSDGSGTNAAGGVNDCAVSSVPACPGDPYTCSGHGTCTSNVCTCDEAYTGYDCSLRTCAKGHAWFDEPSAPNVAHGLVECSNVGICNRASGLCECSAGFEGGACERTSCPQTSGTGFECNGRGRCMNLRTLATFRQVNGVAAPLVYGSIPGSATTWDADKIMGCLCDQGRYDRNQYSWTGPDCAFRTCPRGDDPETNRASTGFYQAEVQQITCIGTGGTFTLGFRGKTTTAIDWDAQATGTNKTLGGDITVTFGSDTVVTSVDIQSSILAGDFIILQNDLKTEERIYTVSTTPSGDTTSAGIVLNEPVGMPSASTYKIYKVVTSVESALEALETIGDVTVSFDSGSVACSGSGVVMSITFHTEHSDVPDLARNSASLTGGSLSLVTSVVGTTEDEECSLHGLCDRATGLCSCDSGWTSSDGQGKYGSKGDCGAIINSKSCAGSFCSQPRL